MTEEMQTYPSIQIARQLLDIADKQPLTPMQVIKMVYLGHGWMLGLNERPLIKEKVMAWPYGPVIRELYEAVRHYRRSPVADIERDANWQPLDGDALHIVKEVFRVYGHLSGVQLSMMTHNEGTPWHITRYKGGAQRNRIIDNKTIRDHFAGLAARNKAT